MAPFSWTSDSRTDVGRVREINEDAVLERSDLGLWVVADGMGGHSAGDVASRSIVERLASVTVPDSLSGFVTDVELALLEVNAQLRALGKSASNRMVGSTVAALLMHGHHGVCLWAGDSRVYRYREGELCQLTQDHAFVEDLVARGYLNRAEASDHPQANLVTRAVGAVDALRVDLEITELAAGDVYLLCSDGVDKELVDDDIRELLSADPPSSAGLVDRVLERGARDNVSAIVVRVASEVDRA